MQVNTLELAERLNIFGCIQCGKCAGGCPVSIKTALNVRFLIYETLVGALPDPTHMEELWDCTCCFTCVERCPKDIQPAEYIIGLRSLLVENGMIPKTVTDALQGIFRQGNPLGLAREQRADWANGLDIRPAQEGCDVLYFAGCTPSYDVRAQPVARALAKTFQAAGLNWGTLGTDETCCGNEVRRVGEQGLFEMLVEEGKPLIESTGAKTMVTTSPHCMNTFKKEYNLNGVEVLHYTQLVAQLIERKQMAFTGKVEKKVTYHDPCFLGKQNHIFDEPRAILRAIPGVKLVEMDRSRERSLCCEGGGGRMWVEGTNMEERLAFQRVHEAADTGAEILAVACPFCLLTLEDAAKVQKLDDRLRVMDIMELVSLAL